MSSSTSRPAVLLIAVAIGVIAVCGCLPGDQLTVSTTTPAGISPELRSVRLETSGCGYASGRTGSGVAMGGGLLLTVAHLIVRAGTIEATIGDDGPVVASPVAVDLERDLAVLRGGPDMDPLELAEASQGDRGRIVGASTSGTVSFEVKRVVDLTIEEILGTDRHGRRGYELSASTADGDSGAGAYDRAGRLIGIVFATSQDGSSTWITASSEIEDFLDAVDPEDTYTPCG